MVSKVTNATRWLVDQKTAASTMEIAGLCQMLRHGAIHSTVTVPSNALSWVRDGNRARPVPVPHSHTVSDMLPRKRNISDPPRWVRFAGNGNTGSLALQRVLFPGLDQHRAKQAGAWSRPGHIRSRCAGVSQSCLRSALTFRSCMFTAWIVQRHPRNTNDN